jgi:hypothetical protein
MQILFGYDARAHKFDHKRVPVVWDSRRLINGHCMIAGKSGTGKTHTLRKMIASLQRQAGKNLRVHIMDAHGDIDIPGACTVKFSESTQYGFNPLQVNEDPDFGGVRKRLQSFIGALNRTSRKLGTKQESCLRALLQDIYSANGFHDGQPATWRLNDGVARKNPKKHPTMSDAVRFAQFKLKALYLGTSHKAVGALEALNKKMAQLHARARQQNKSFDPGEKERVQKEVESLGSAAIDLFIEHVGAIQTGHEAGDILRYGNKDVLRSVAERLENLEAIGIFKPVAPPFDAANPVWRYDIKSLAADEKRLFVSFVLERIFHAAIERGVVDDVVEVIVLDEAHLYLDDDPDNITNILSKEARKFGIALLCASQSPTHFTDDFLSNVGAKIILGLDEMYWADTARKMKVKAEYLTWIAPQKSLVVQFNNRGETRSEFKCVFQEETMNAIDQMNQRRAGAKGPHGAA